MVAVGVLDWGAVTQVQDGRPFAEEAIEHLDSLYRGALRLTRDPDAAQDLVQDAYARALRYQHSYKPGTNMKAWLFAIMRNLFWDRSGKAARESVSLDDVSDFTLYDALRDEITDEGPESSVLDGIAAREVVQAINRLSPLHREIVMLVGDVPPSPRPPAAAARPLRLRRRIRHRPHGEVRMTERISAQKRCRDEREKP